MTFRLAIHNIYVTPCSLPNPKIDFMFFFLHHGWRNGARQNGESSSNYSSRSIHQQINYIVNNTVSTHFDM